MSDDATLDGFADTIADENKEGSRITGLGTFPADWDVERITGCAEIRDSERVPLNSQEREQKKPGEIPYYGANGVLEYISEHIFDSDLILLAEDGGHFEEHQKRPVAYRISGKSWVNNHAHILEAKDGITFDYLFYSLEHRNLVPYVSGSTRSKLTQTMLKKVEVPLPPLPEQRKIATVLYTVDRAIDKTENIVEQIRRVKMGIQQELFTEGYYDHNSSIETRVGTLPESWRLEKVKNSTQLVSGAHVNSHLVSEESSLTPYLTGPDDFDELGFTVSKYTHEPTKFCEAGDTLVTVKGSGCGKSTFANQRACISRQLKAIRPSDGLDELYLFYFLETKQTLLENLAEGSAIPGLSNSHLTGLDIPVPSMDEQHRISETLKVYDNGIVREKNYKSQLHRLKRGLMQDLLSGKVRMTNTQIEVPDEIAQHD